MISLLIPRGSLRARREDESGFTFGPQIGLVGKDPFDSAEPVKPYGTVMATCIMCHGLPGIYSVNSIADLFGNRTLQNLRTLGVSGPAAETEKARRFKEGYYFDRFKAAARTVCWQSRMIARQAGINSPLASRHVPA